jgi:hypothetical protein
MSSLSKAVENQIKKTGNTIYIKRFNPSTEKNIYGESKRKLYRPPTPIPAMVKFNPSEETITEAGLKKEQLDVLVRIAYESLAVRKLTSKDGMGTILTTDDLLVINNIEYNITQLIPVAQFGQFLLYHIGGIKIGGS